MAAEQLQALGLELMDADRTISAARIIKLPDEVELFLPRLQLWTRARVVWRGPSACGVEFLRG